MVAVLEENMNTRREYVDEEHAKTQGKQEVSLEGNQTNLERPSNLSVPGSACWILEVAVEGLAEVPTESGNAMNTRR